MALLTDESMEVAGVLLALGLARWDARGVISQRTMKHFCHSQGMRPALQDYLCSNAFCALSLSG